MRFIVTIGKWTCLLAGILGLGVVLKAVRRRTRCPEAKTSVKGDPSPKLWMFNHYAISPDMPGGTRHYELSTLLKQHGWGSTVFAAPCGHEAGSADRHVSPLRPMREVDENGVDFVWLYSVKYQRNDWRRYINMVSFLVTSVWAGVTRPRPEVVIGSSPHLFAAFGAWIVARRHRVPFVLEIRDLWPESLVQLGLTNRPIVTALALLESFLYRNADHIIALTEGIAKGIVSKNIPEEKVTLVSNAAMRPAPFDERQRCAARSVRGWRDEFVGIWIGAHGPANGLDVIIDAARLLRPNNDVKLVLVGSGSEKPALIEAANDLDNVEFLDPVPKSDVQDVLRAADIGIIVHRDTLAVKGARPNKLFDYMAAGLPIVLNLDGEARGIVERSGVGLFVEVECPQALADGILKLRDDEDSRREMGQRGFAMAQQSYSREDTADILAGLLETINVRSGVSESR